MQGEWSKLGEHLKADAEVLGEEMKGIFGGVGASLGDGFKVAEDDIDGWIKSLKGELAELNAWWEGHGDKARPNMGPKILGPGDPGYDEAPTAEKMSYRGRIPDLQKEGGGLQKAAFRTGEETPGAEIKAEAVVYRATMRGTAEGSRIGFLNAFHELEDEKRRGAGGGMVPAAYHPGGAAEGGGLGGGYGGLGGGPGGGLGGSPGGVAPGGAETAPSERGIGRGAPGGAETAPGGRGPSGAPGGRSSNGAPSPGAPPSGETGEHPLSAHAQAMRKQFGHPSKGGGDSVYGMIDKAAAGDKRTADIMKAIFEGESNHIKGVYDAATRGEASYGPFQLNKHGGLGAQFQKETGRDPANPSSVQAQTSWVADYIKRNRGPISQWKGLQHGIERIQRGQIHPNDTAMNTTSTGRTAEQHQALVETAKRANPATLGALSKPGAESAEAGAGYGQGTPPPLKVTGAQMAGVDPKIVEAVTAGASHMPKGYSVEIFSGKRGGTDPHGHGEAIDVRIRKPDGTLIPDRGADTTGMYQRLAQLTYGEIKARHPELANRYAWGGSFETSRGSGVPDLMHHDLMGRRGGIRPGMHPQIQALGAIPLAPERPAELAKKPPVELPKKLPADIHQRARSMFGHPHMQSADLLGNARKAGMMGGQSQKVTGEASMRIDLRGFPKGTKTKTEMSGMFSQIRVARGRAMPLANQDS